MADEAQKLFDAYWAATKAAYHEGGTPWDALTGLAGLVAAICVARGPDALAHFDKALTDCIERHFRMDRHP
jgi:hypothetical protein